MNTASTSTHSLSDLAQAASSRLMAENSSSGTPSGATAATSSRSAAETATPSPASPSSRESSVERENPEQHLLGDHSYSSGMRRSRMMPPQSASALDHSYTRRAHGALADLRERMRELSRTAEAAEAVSASGFSHSPESEFVEVGSGHPASRSAFEDNGLRRTARAPDVGIKFAITFNYLAHRY